MDFHGFRINLRSHGQKLSTEKTVLECREKVNESEAAVKSVVEAEEAGLWSLQIVLRGLKCM